MKFTNILWPAHPAAAPLFQSFFLWAFRVFYFIGVGLPLPAQQLYAPESVQQGQILQTFIYPVHNLEAVEYTLLATSGKVVGKAIAQSKGFLLNYERGVRVKQLDARIKDWVNIGLLGIASSQADGHYMLRATVAKNRSHSQSLERPIYIQTRKFPSQTIKLSPKMDSILNPRDPDVIARQRLQANRFWAIIKRDNPEDLYYSGTLMRPLEEGKGWLSSPYGYVRKYVYPSDKITNSVHKGYDIAAPQGTKVFSSGDGLVVLAEDRIVTGKTVMISLLPGVFLKYQHLSTLNVGEADVVKKGDLIGEVGKTGFATGNHLHTELWVSGQQVDPTLYFDDPLIDTNKIVSMIAQN